MNEEANTEETGRVNKEKATKTEERRKQTKEKKNKREAFNFPTLRISVWNLQFQNVSSEMCCCVPDLKNNDLTILTRRGRVD